MTTNIPREAVLRLASASRTDGAKRSLQEHATCANVFLYRSTCENVKLTSWIPAQETMMRCIAMPTHSHV